MAVVAIGGIVIAWNEEEGDVGVCCDVSEVGECFAGVGHGEGRYPVRAGAYAIDGAAACFDPHEIVAKIIHLLFDTRLASFADGYHTDHGSDADGDAHDGQHAAHFISEQGY